MSTSLFDFLSMLLMVVRIELLLGDVVVLRRKHVELGVFEHFVGIFGLCLSHLCRFASVCDLSQLSSLLVQLSLKFGRLWVEAIVECEPLAKRAELPKAQRACTNDSGRFKETDLLVHGKFLGVVSQRDLPELEENGHGKQGAHLALVLLNGFVFAPVFVLGGVV